MKVCHWNSFRYTWTFSQSFHEVFQLLGLQPLYKPCIKNTKATNGSNLECLIIILHLLCAMVMLYMASLFGILSTLGFFQSSNFWHRKSTFIGSLRVYKRSKLEPQTRTSIQENDFSRDSRSHDFFAVSESVSIKSWVTEFWSLEFMEPRTDGSSWMI